MHFSEILNNKKDIEWENYYLDYNLLKNMIKILIINYILHGNGN